MLTFLMIVLALVIFAVAGILFLSFTLGMAMVDLYAVLSFEPLLLDDVLARVERSNSRNLERYFGSRFYRLAARIDLDEGGVDRRYLKHQMLMELLESMEKTKEVKIEHEQATLEWIEANAHRLYALPPVELERWRTLAVSVEEAPPHTEDFGCERCEREELLEYAIFVRKLPKGRRPPRLRLPNFLGVPRHA